MANQVALITGITGQTGSYLARHLLNLGYEVHGVVRRLSQPNFERIQPLLDDPAQIKLWPADLHDQTSLLDVLKQVRPTEVYNLAAQSFVPTSWNQPILTAEVTALGVLRVLEAIRLVDTGIRFYQASSSEMFGKVREEPQTELTPIYPRSPYGVSKAFGHHMTINYRESYGIYACSGICFNHESPCRGVEFVTRKITDAVARIKVGLETTLKLGNLDAMRDWGYAGDYVRAMHLILQQPQADDYVVATGEKHSVREFCQLAFARVGLSMADYVVVDPALYRPAEVATLLGNPAKIKALGWQPDVSFSELVEMMTDADLKRWCSKTGIGYCDDVGVPGILTRATFNDTVKLSTFVQK